MQLPEPIADIIGDVDITAIINIIVSVLGVIGILASLLAGIGDTGGNGGVAGGHPGPVVVHQQNQERTPVVVQNRDKANKVTVINQGDPVYIGNQGLWCTAGYVDNANRKLYIAAHCFDKRADPESPVFGEPVYNKDRAIIGHYTAGTRVNTAYDSSGNPVTIVDTAEITLVDGVRGENTYSGDTVVRWSDIDPQTDIACFTGVTTQRVTGRVVCGTIEKVGEEAKAVYVHADTNSLGGDSGGPIWIPGKGFIGVISAGGAGMTSSKTVDNGSINVFNNVEHQWSS